MNQYHVLFDMEKRDWYIIKDGAKRNSGRFSLKTEAVKKAREMSRKAKTELVIHGKDGKIQSKDSHGNDPQNIPG